MLDKEQDNLNDYKTEGKKADIKFLEILKRFISTKLILASIILIVIGILLIILSFSRSGTNVFFFIMQETGKAIFITALISGAIKWYLTRQAMLLESEKDRVFREQLSFSLNELKSKIIEQTQKMTKSSKSLDALRSANIAKVYEKRLTASEDIKATLEHKSVEQIKIIGISLNDFIRDEHSTIHMAWESIEGYIANDRPPEKSEKLTIQVLLIDPKSSGAYYRGMAESTEDLFKTRIDKDVLSSLEHFYNLEKAARDNKNVSFKARIYRLPPILYLIWTPSTSYVQQYYFRPRHSGINIPVLKYYNQSGLDSTESSIHEELKFHFDYIWDRVSVSLDEYFVTYSLGTDNAIRKAKIKNIFYDQDISRNRIIHLIKNTNKILWIKGISLKSYFRSNSPLCMAIYDACKRNVEDIKILMIDPDSEQGEIRSFREYLINNPTGRSEDFVDDARKRQRLYKDTMDSIEFIEENLVEFSQNKKSNFQVRLFKSAPEAFILITDESVLVEQYHYGKIDKDIEGMKKILGGDFPIFEYHKTTNGEEEETFAPYKILKDHFEFVFNRCSRRI